MKTGTGKNEYFNYLKQNLASIMGTQHVVRFQILIAVNVKTECSFMHVYIGCMVNEYWY